MGRRVPRTSRKTVVISIARILVLATVISVATAAHAARCEPDRGQLLRAAQANVFNAYYFSSTDDPDRCMDLQSAIFRQQQLVAWLEECDRPGAPGAGRELTRLAGLLSDPANCLH